MILRCAKLASPQPVVDLFSHIESITNQRDPNSTCVGKQLFARMLGQANEFKEGDLSIGVAAANPKERDFARGVLARTKICDIERYPYHVDQLYSLCREVDPVSAALTNNWELSRLKKTLLSCANEYEAILPGLSSDVIGCTVKLMSNDELVQLGSQIFHPIPGSKLGSKGYFGARVQPNSATDDPQDIFWQVLNAFSLAVGDVMLGTNPVSSDPKNVLRTQLVLKDIIDTFQLSTVLPHCVLSHIDIQANVELNHPNSTALWFQSIAGSDSANQTFDLPIATMLQHAATRIGRFGLYLETGQGADYTNGHSRGIDMVMHDARKFGFARALKRRVAQAQRHGRGVVAQVYINNVAGFIGPECFRTKEQLVRVCLEDIAMGKLHGLTVGLDVCATLHMDITLDDLDWCLDQILPANPAWAMALPTKNDPMLSYLTTSYQDHIRLRNKFGYRVDDAMWRFFAHELQVVDAVTGKPTPHFGDLAWVYLKYHRRKFGLDEKSDAEILQEARQMINAVQVPLALGHGRNVWDLQPELDARIRNLCTDAKESLWRELPPNTLRPVGFDSVVELETNARSRQDYVFHPKMGESLSARSVQLVEPLRNANMVTTAIVISDGLCVDAILDQGHLDPFLESLQRVLLANQVVIHPQVFVISNGRVRVGYEIGKLLFPAAGGCICHVIGERPGNGHHTFSAYMTTSKAWSTAQVDHNITRVVSGIADTAYDPHVAGEECAKIIMEMVM